MNQRLSSARKRKLASHTNMSAVQTTRVNQTIWLNAHMRTNVLLQTLSRCVSNPSMWSAQIHASPISAPMMECVEETLRNAHRPKFVLQVTISAQISRVLKAWHNTANVLN